MPTQSSLTEEQIEGYREAFDLLDKDRDGVITIEELKTAMQILGKGLEWKELEEMMSEADSDGNGVIDFTEFLTTMARKIKSVDEEHEFAECFRAFDQENKGYITLDDLSRIVASLGYNHSPEEISSMFKEADLDHDNKITFEEFRCMMKPTKQ